MSKIAIIGDGFSALFTALELAKKNEEILVISSQKDEFESGILTPFNTPALARDGAIYSSFLGLVSKKSELDIALCLNENFRAWMANFTLKSTKAHDKKMRILFKKFLLKELKIPLLDIEEVLDKGHVYSENGGRNYVSPTDFVFLFFKPYKRVLLNLKRGIKYDIFTYTYPYPYIEKEIYDDTDFLKSFDELKEMIEEEQKKILFNQKVENLSEKYNSPLDERYDFILNKVDDKYKSYYIFLDEIQEVEEWERCVNSLRVDEDFNFDIYITGSNAKLLSGELSTYLAGRYIEFVVYPFSFKEFFEIIQEKNQEIKVKEAFQKYVKFGGMPFLHNLDYNFEASMQYLQDLYASIILKDITQRNNIRDTDLLERIINYVVMNIGNTFSATSISKFFKSENRKVATETILNYIKACEEAFLVYRVARNDLLGKKILNVNEKYYIADHGIREAIMENNQKNINQVLENIVYFEMLRRGYNVKIGKVDNLEVDFVCKKNDETIYIQVSYLLASEDTKEREFSVLENIKDNYPKYVLSMDEFDMSRNGIKHVNLIEFLVK